jgi:hypothetical protein
LGVVIGLMSAEDDVVVEDDADDETMTSISPPPKPLAPEDDLPLFLLWKSGDMPSR